VVFDLLARLPAEQGMEESECVNQALKEGKQAYLQRRITSEASIGKILFGNGFKLAENLGLTSGRAAGQGHDMRSERVRLLKEFKELSRRLDRIRLLALAEDFDRRLRSGRTEKDATA
jgi:glycerol-3-phosphate O-acyltransferase